MKFQRVLDTLHKKISKAEIDDKACYEIHVSIHQT